MINLAGLVFSCSGICSYVTTTNVQGVLFACNTNPSFPPGCNTQSFNITTQNGAVDGSRFLLSPDGESAGIDIFAVASASHGSLSAKASATDLAYPPSSATGISTGTASFSEFWTIDTGLGGGFIDIVLQVSELSIGASGSCASFQNVGGLCSSHTFSTGKQAFSDNTPFAVTGTVVSSSSAIGASYTDIELSITSLNIYDVQMNLLSNYSLTVTDTPVPEASTWAQFVLAGLMFRKVSKTTFSRAGHRTRKRDLPT